MQEAKNAGQTNEQQGSVTRVVSAAPTNTWVSPAENQVFKLNNDATLPEIIFEFITDATGPYKWSWCIEWDAKASGLREKARQKKTLKSFKESGEFESADKKWTVNFDNKILGGKLTVKVQAGENKLERVVNIKGQNPGAEAVKTYINSLDGIGGFDKLLEQETRSKHFINLDNEPIVAFDQGYGITQITNPAPTYSQVWSWKENIVVGSELYKKKRKLAENYLGKDGRTYTEEQLQHETYSLWNGGHYHKWDADKNEWVRKENILCDSQTGNIGWDMSKTANSGHTESELHNRDKDSYKLGSKGKTKEHEWFYTGVCYADHVLGE